MKKVKCKKILCLVLIICLVVSFTGCWDYRGLNELTIVAGFALDESENGGYLLSLEIIDTSASQNNTAASKLIQSEGETIAEAVYNVTSQLQNNIYFGNADIAIFGHQLVEKKGLENLIDPLIRDNSMRDNLTILISKEETAYELIKPEEEAKMIISFDINNKIMGNKQSMTATSPKEIFEIYGILSRQSSNLALPVIGYHNKDEKDLSLDGLAVFDGDQLAGYFPEEKMQYYLLLIKALRGGGFVHREKTEDNEEAKITIGIRRSSPKIDYEYNGSELNYTIKLELIVSAVEFSKESEDIYKSKDKDLQKLKKLLEKELATSIEAMVSDYQKTDLPDIFGFADAIYYKDPTLWQEIEEGWSEKFKNAKVKAECKITINDTGLIKKY